jgi:AcrR family transcriptional regulator
MTETTIARGSATRTANKLRRKARILECAREIIAEDGYDALTLSQLAKRSAVTVPTIHNLLGRKSQIIEAIVGDVVTKIGVVLDAQTTTEPIQSIEAFTQALAQLYRQDEALYKASFVAGERAGLFEYDAPDGIYQRSLDLALRVCTAAKEDGYLQGEIATAQLAAQVFGAQRLARLDWIRGYIDLPTYRRKTRDGIFIVLAADATPMFRARLIEKISA